MEKKGHSQLVRSALVFAPVFIVPAAFFASIPWLKKQSETVSLGLAAACAIFVMSYAVFLSARVNRKLDELQLTGQRIAQTKGMTIGSFVFVLVMIFPPAMNGLIDLAAAAGGGSSESAARFGIVIGFVAVVLLQTLGAVAVSIWWGRRISGEG